MNMQVNKQKLAEAQARIAARYSPEDMARFAQERADADAKWKAAGSPVGIPIDSLPGFGFGPNARLPRDPAKEAEYERQFEQQVTANDSGGLGPTHSYDEPWSPYVAQTSNGGSRGTGSPFEQIEFDRSQGMPTPQQPIPSPNPDDQAAGNIGNPNAETGLESKLSGRGPAFQAWANQFAKKQQRPKLNPTPLLPGR